MTPGLSGFRMKGGATAAGTPVIGRRATPRSSRSSASASASGWPVIRAPAASALYSRPREMTKLDQLGRGGDPSDDLV